MSKRAYGYAGFISGIVCPVIMYFVFVYLFGALFFPLFGVYILSVIIPAVVILLSLFTIEDSKAVTIGNNIDKERSRKVFYFFFSFFVGLVLFGTYVWQINFADPAA